MTTSEITLVRVTGATPIPVEVKVLVVERMVATGETVIGAVVIVVMQVPHRLGHGGGVVVI